MRNRSKIPLMWFASPALCFRFYFLSFVLLYFSFRAVVPLVGPSLVFGHLHEFVVVCLFDEKHKENTTYCGCSLFVSTLQFDK